MARLAVCTAALLLLAPAARAQSDGAQPGAVPEYGGAVPQYGGAVPQYGGAVPRSDGEIPQYGPQAGGVVPQATGFHQHDGFFLQLTGGLGGLGTKASQDGNTWKMSGTGGLFSIALGGSLTENFALGFELWSTSVSSPEVEFNGMSGTADGSFGLGGFGANLTYYFMPANIYVQATPSIATLSVVDSNGNTGSSERGFAIRLAVGKEWWVSTDWGIGLNVQYARSSNKDSGPLPPTFATNWFGVAFSATYN